MDKIMMNEETDIGGSITRVFIRNTDSDMFQIDVHADGNHTGQEYSRQELRMIRELITNVDLENII